MSLKIKIRKWLQNNIGILSSNRDRFPKPELREDSKQELYEKYKSAIEKVRKDKREKDLKQQLHSAKNLGLVTKNQSLTKNQKYLDNYVKERMMEQQNKLADISDEYEVELRERGDIHIQVLNVSSNPLLDGALFNKNYTTEPLMLSEETLPIIAKFIHRKVSEDYNSNRRRHPAGVRMYDRALFYTSDPEGENFDNSAQISKVFTHEDDLQSIEDHLNITLQRNHNNEDYACWFYRLESVSFPLAVEGGCDIRSHTIVINSVRIG